MKPYLFLRLLGITVAGAIIAVCLWIYSPDYGSDKEFGQKLFPDVFDKINDTAVLSIEHDGKTLTFMRDPVGTWRTVEYSNYPADKERIRNSLLGLASLEKVEKKTAVADFYPEIRVEDSAPGAMSYLVTLLNADGEQILHLLVGKTVTGFNWDGQGHFVRVPGDPQAWLVRGALDVTGDFYSWTDTRLLPQVTKDSLNFVSILSLEDRRMIAFSRMNDHREWEAVDASDPYISKDDSYLKEMTDTLSSLEFLDVVPKPETLETTQPHLFVSMLTENKIQVSVFIYLINDEPHAYISAKETALSDDEAREEVKQINERHESWLYQIPSNVVFHLSPFLPLPPPKEEIKNVKTDVPAKEVATEKDKKAPTGKRKPKSSSVKQKEKASSAETQGKEKPATQGKTAKKNKAGKKKPVAVASEKKAADVKTENKPATQEKPADVKAEDKPAAQEKPTDVKTEDKPATQEKPAEVKAENKPATQEKPAEVKAEDKPATQGKPADVKAEDKPAA